MKHVTRIAPSPTGLFHIGSARTALFNWLIAKSTGGEFMLRIDDTDQGRNTPEAVQVIYDSMKWLGLDFDIEHRQSDSIPDYLNVARMMITNGDARYDGDAIRFVLNDCPPSWTDTISGVVNISEQDRSIIDGMVLIRSDGIPTYHFASVIDDMTFGITWIVRGIDHFSNTSKHVPLWKAIAKLDEGVFERPLPLFTHVGLITQNGKKVSKRDGAASLLQYRDDGVSADAMLNWLLRLGWGPTVDDKTTRMISKDRALEIFLQGGNMRAASSNMDLALLASLDRKYKGAIERAKRGLS